MALFGRKKSTIGLDVGSGLIKVAVIDHSRGEPELARVVVTPLLADAIVEGEVMDPGIVTDAIRMALGQSGLKSRDVVTAVGGRDVIIKKIQIERVKEQQARELMRWEAEQHVPFDMESVELDFQILDPEGSGVDMSVLLVAAKRELIESKMRLLSEAGANPSVVDHSKKEPELTKVAVQPLQQDAIVEGEVMDPGVVSEAIGAALSAAGVSSKKVVTAVGGRDVIIKKIQIERVKEQQARELMRWEA
ncbi:MAG TPA: pilus assembly protein PilM, partial [Vicinamibacterales bacterium]|nr:pilus assembly protein PilM [Vicinamibacterales bacterium]